MLLRTARSLARPRATVVVSGVLPAQPRLSVEDLHVVEADDGQPGDVHGRRSIGCLDESDDGERLAGAESPARALIAPNLAREALGTSLAVGLVHA